MGGEGAVEGEGAAPPARHLQVTGAGLVGVAEEAELGERSRRM